MVEWWVEDVETAVIDETKKSRRDISVTDFTRLASKLVSRWGVADEK